MSRLELRNLALMALFFVGAWMMLASREASSLEAQLQEQRRRRAALEVELEKRETQLNQALEHIHQANGDEQPAGG